MAIVQNPITGRTRGKFSTAVFSKQFGKNTMRSKALSVRNPKTPAQLEQRAKFNTALNFVRQIIGIVRIGYAKFASGMSAYNTAMRQLMLEAVSGVYPDFDISYADVLISQGALTGFSAPAALAAPVLKINLAWTDNTGQGNAAADDILYYCIINKDAGTVTAGTNNRTRTAGADVINSAGAAGEDCEVYAFFVSATTGEACDSVYLGNHVLVNA